MELNIYTQGGIKKITVSPSASSSWNTELMVENAVSLSFTHTTYIQLDVNDFIMLQNVRFSIQKQYKPKQKSEQEYAYSVKFYGPEHDAERVMCLNLTDDQYEPQFSLDGSPREHLQKVVDNLNRLYEEDRWSIGEVIIAANQTIEYNNAFCWDALASQAEAFETEWWADGYTLNLCRCERGERISLGYLQGLKSLTPSENDNDIDFFTRLIPRGSTKNIDATRYGYSRLQLPDRSKYIDLNVDKYGIYDHVEEAAFTEIYPHYTGTITEVRNEQKTGDDGTEYTAYFFKDSDMLFDPNDNIISEGNFHVSFQSGDLNGRDFEAYYHTGTQEWEIINTYPDKKTQIPGGNLIPKVGDTYIPWNFRMPTAYETQAEEDYKVAVDDFLAKYSFDTKKYGGDTDYNYITKNNIPLLLGQNVHLISDKYFGDTGYLDTRMTKVVHKLENLNIATIECTKEVGQGWKSRVDNSISEFKYVIAQQQSEAILDILRSYDGREATDYRVMSALRTLNEIVNRSISRLKPDTAAEIIDFLKGITIDGDKASIDADGVATVQQLIALIKAKVTELEVTNTATAKNVAVSEKVTTLNAVIQALAKTHDLTVENTADIMNGIIREYLTSESFVSGFLGNGFKIWKDTNGDWCGEFDKLTVRKIFTVFELVVQKVVHQGGMVIRSAAGGKLVKVTDGGTYWKCEHDSTDDFVLDDQIFCQTFTGTSMKRYWRKVTSAGMGYFNLSKTDCEYGSAKPVAGDEVAVLGNRTNTDRQSAQIDCAVGVNAPYRDDYKNINSYSLEGKLVCRSGNCAGIVDDIFGALDETINFYGKGVRLRGSFALESSGKLVEDEISGQISDVRTELEITAGQISTKVQAATTAATQAAGSASAAAGSASNAANSASQASGILASVTQKETNINQTANAIELKATRAETAAGRAESAEASINVKADGIVMQAAQTAVNGVQIGTENLFRNSKCIVDNAVQNVTSNGATLSVDTVNTYLGEPTMKVVGSSGFYWNYNPIIKPDTIYTISMMAKSNTELGDSGTTPLHIQIPLNDHYYESQISHDNGITTTWKQLTRTFKSTASTDQRLRCYLYSIGSAVVNIAWIKLEEGSKATAGYTQAPEDIDANIALRPTTEYLKSQLTITPGGITLLGKTLSLAGMVTFSSLDSSAQSTINAKATKSEAQGYATIAVDAVQIGGRNLIPGTSNGIGWDASTYSDTTFTRTAASTGETAYIYSPYFELKGNQQYTLSFESKEDSTITSRDLYILSNNYASNGAIVSVQFDKGINWHKVAWTFTTPSGFDGVTDIRLRIDHNGSSNGSSATIYARNIKLEEGNKKTTYTPAPGDVSVDATNKANTAKENLATSLGYSSYSAMAAAASAGQSIINGAYIRTGLIEARAITADKIAAGTITANEIKAGTITADRITSNTITSAQVNVAELQAALVTADKIQALNIVTGKLTVTTGAKIAGFKVSGTILTNMNDNGTWTNDASVIFKNDTHECFAGIGGNVLPATSGGRAVARFENEDRYNQWGYNVNYAMILSAKNADENYALMISNGYIGGFSVKVRQISSSTTLYHYDCFVSCYNTGTISVYLPSSPQVGKMIYVMRVNHAQVNVYGNGRSIKNGGSSVSSIPINNDGEIDFFLFDGQYWMYSYFNQ